MAVADIPVVYGGPFADETDVLQAEINQAKAEGRRPNFSKVTENWISISAGTKQWLKEREDFITVDPEPIVENVQVDYENPDEPSLNITPDVVDTDSSPDSTTAGFVPASDPLADILDGGE